MSEKIAKIVAKTVEQILKVEANSVSCIWTYEPAVPEELKQFKRCNKEERK